jgi:hypothetical protein
MSHVVNTVLVELWTILDLSRNPLTGMNDPGDIAFTLHRSSGSAMVAAAEAVAMTEIGVTGHYSVSYTPTNVAIYVLQLEEINTGTFLRTYRFPDVNVVSAGSIFAPSFANAFCAETDMERWLQQPITGTTAPTSDEAAGFAEARAAVLMTLCAKWGFTVTPSTVVSGSRLEDLLREANAVGASMDYTIAQSFSKTPSKTDRIETLLGVWYQHVGDPTRPTVAGYLECEIKGNLSSLSTDHIISGDTQAAAAETVTSEAIQIRMGDLF